MKMGRPASPIAKEVRMREYRKAYKLKHPDRIKESKEKWRKANMDIYRKWSIESRARHIDKVKERARIYAKNNPHKIAQKNAARKARLYNARREKYERLGIYDRDNGVCCICFDIIDLDLPARHVMSFTIQHHIPLSKGGADAPDNLGIAHYSCNSRVGNRKETSNEAK